MYSIGYGPKTREGLDSPLFKKVLLLNVNELGDIVHNLNRLSDAGSSDESRERLYDTWLQILKEYLGNISEKDLIDLTIEEINMRVFGLPSPTSFINDIKLKDITDESRLDDTKLNIYAKRIMSKANDLNKIYNNTRDPRQFVTNNRRYYWIEEDLIP